MRKIRQKNGSGLVTIPKEYLQMDGVLVDGEIPECHHLVVDYLDTGVYAIRLTQDGDIPSLREAEGIRQIVADRLLDGGAAELLEAKEAL
ncbi:hypothetical protein VB773_14900 [Haloarculaceae archaeon H-GB2-1]|nr:hypothetical protein [Haloarculaceae archaeon H-GB1-1]MEA5408723.1 hypothetical protein [Haloarculaceae archaeon H-GB2-1]